MATAIGDSSSLLVVFPVLISCGSSFMQWSSVRLVLIPLAVVLGLLVVITASLLIRLLLWRFCRKNSELDKSKLRRRKAVFDFPKHPMGKVPVDPYVDAIQIKAVEIYGSTHKPVSEPSHHRRSLEMQSQPLLEGAESDGSRCSSLSDLSCPSAVSSTGKIQQPGRTKGPRQNISSELARYGKSASFDSASDVSKGDERHERKFPRFSEPAPGRRRPSSVVTISGSVGGQLEFIVNYNSEESCLEVNLVRLIDVDLRPEYFLGTLEVANKWERRTSAAVCLVMDESKNLVLSDTSQLGFLVHAQLWPGSGPSRTSRIIPVKGAKIFNETLDFVGEYDQLLASKLMLYLLCKFGKGGEPIVLGEVVVGLASLRVGLPLAFTANICQTSQEIELEDVLGATSELGELKVQLAFNPIAEKLSVAVLSGKWLPKLGVTGAPSTSVKVLIYHLQNRIAKRTTSVERRTRNPNYNQTFSFDISKDKMSSCDVLFIVRHHGAMYRTRIGYVLVGCSAGSEGYKHWCDCMEFADPGRSHKILQQIPVTLSLQAPK